jgi:DNA-binding CsgD family transcriptional regulator
MSLSKSDDATLLQALYEGAEQEFPWRTFLLSLQRRCSAETASLLFAPSDNAETAALAWTTAHRATDVTGLRGLRPLRVYSFEEVDDLRRTNGGAPIFGRIARVNASQGWSAWVMIERSASDFAASDSAFLSALAPHIAIAMQSFAAIEGERQRLAIAEDLLRRAGIAWRVAPDPPAQTARRAADAPHEDALTLPMPPGLLASSGAVVVTRFLRAPGPERLHYLARLWSLTASEARFAAAVADGKSLQEAASALDLTIETARHYSKRLYAKTGARGLPDLVRLVLTSAAPLA